MNTSLALWQTFPDGFLKKKYRGWNQLDYEVQLLIVELAKAQNFKCAFCSQDWDLEIEHDHDPWEGAGDKPTIHNIRGLACRGCNGDISLYEREQRGEYSGLENVWSKISRHDYEDYADKYDCRVGALREAALEKAMGEYVYRCRRQPLLSKFDDWNEWGADFPWQSHFEEIKAKRHGPIRTPLQFMKSLNACLRFIVEEKKKDPNFQPPDQFVKLLVQIKPVLDKARSIVEE